MNLNEPIATTFGIDLMDLSQNYLKSHMQDFRQQAKIFTGWSFTSSKDYSPLQFCMWHFDTDFTDLKTKFQRLLKKTVVVAFGIEFTDLRKKC